MQLTPRRAVVLLAYALVIAMSVATTTDPDLWWHLRTGDVIVSDGLPRGDIFSFTVPGRAWVTHEWGSQVLMWGLWSATGAPGLIVAFTALVTASFIVAHRTSTARATVTSAIVVLAAATARLATAPRPQMFNLVFLAGMILLLERIRQRRLDPRWVWAAIPIMTIWSNLHSGYLLGVVTLGVYAVGERLEARRTGGRPIDGGIVRQLPLVAALSFAAAAVNPNGWAMWRYPFDTLRSDAMRTYINEWQSPDFHSPWFWPFAAFLVVAVVSLIVSTRKPGATQSLLLFGTAMAGLQSMRHIPLFAVVAIPIVAEQVEVSIDAARASRRSRTRPSVLSTSRPIALLSAALAGIITVMFLSAAIGNNDEAVAARFPVDAVNAIQGSELADTRGYNIYGWGGYLIWRDMPVFIDGRADVYGDEFMYLHHQAEEAEADWREPLDQFDVQYVLLEPGEPLAVILEAAPDWQSVYVDDVAEVFARCTDRCPTLG